MFFRKYQKYNSYKGTVERVIRNRIHRRFYTSIHHQKVTTDTSEFKYYARVKTISSLSRNVFRSFSRHVYGEVITYRVSELPSQMDISLQSSSNQHDVWI